MSDLSERLVRYDVPLSSSDGSRMAHLTLPALLTDEEAERLAVFIRSVSGIRREYL